jgi:hypothetical protein
MDERAISEIIGAMMLLLIAVLYLGVMQAYEVPQWNKEIERNQFDTIYDDFVKLRSDIEDVAHHSLPKTTTLHLGTRYPQRFLLRNPGPGIYGSLSTYPVHINISYTTSTGGLQWKNYTSTAITYDAQYTAALPKIVFENGIIIKDFGTVNLTDDTSTTLFSEDNIFIPLLKGINSTSSMGEETLNLRPAPLYNASSTRFDVMNIEIETRYPDVWANLTANASGPRNSTITVGSGKIHINNIQGYNLSKISFPMLGSGIYVYSGLITIDDSQTGGRGPTGAGGQDMWAKGDRRLDIPSSSTATSFLIKDITPTSSDEDGKLKFAVKDRYTEWEVEIKLRYQDNNTLTVKEVKRKKPKPDKEYTEFRNLDISDSRTIDLTTRYQAQGITTPNILVIEDVKNLLYVNFVLQ